MTLNEVLLLAGISLGSLVFSGLVGGWLLIRIPPDYFLDEGRRRKASTALWKRILKNIVGVLLVAVGLVLAIPGVPGQGLLTILAGLMIMDLPGKYKLERRILSLGPIRFAVNKLRAWGGRPPLQFPQP